METPPSRNSTASAAAADSALRLGADADEEKAPVAAGAPPQPPPPAEFLVHVAQQIRRGFHKSLTQVISEIGDEYGIQSSSLAQLETGDLVDNNNTNSDQQQAIPSDVRLIIQELQSSRYKERELRAQVDALQAEQKLASERLALYAVLALKLKRELINERLAHIDSKKEAQQQHQDSGDEAANNPSRRSSLEPPPHNADEDDPWSSPNKTPGSTATAGSKLLSFTSFYHSSRAAESGGGGGGSESEPPSPMSSTSGGLQPLRNSLMGQFLPSSLLDSPQITPSSRASATSSNRSFGGKKDDTSVSSAAERLTFEAEIKEGLDAFTLSDPPCTQCRQHPVSECAPCGHRLCTNCEASVLARQDFELTCPRCRAKVSSVKELTSRKGREEDNQLDHFLEGSDVSLSSGSKQQSGTPGDAAAIVSPITLSLLAELFDSIPVEQLETALKESSGQASLAIEKILHTHPSFNPGFASGGGGSNTSESPIAPGHKASTLHRSSSNAATSSNQERTGGSGGGSGGGGNTSNASSNWKTEMCMYYLQGKCNKTRRTCSFAHGESDLVRNTSTQSKHSSGAAGAGFKSRMCPLYLEGICPKSRRDCPLAHGESDLRDGALSMASSGGASLSLPAAAPRLQSYKTELCYYYLKGCCNYTKEECRFAHGEGDLRTVESNTMEWSQKLGGGGGLGGGMGGGMGSGDYSSGPGSVSSVSTAPSGAAAGGPPGLSLDKQLQHQHQYQQQFQPQSQYQSQPLQQLQPPQQPPQAPPGQPQQLQHGSPAFPPPPHQLGGLPHTLAHQFSPYHQQLPPQHHHQQHMPPPHMPAMPSMYHSNAPAQTHQFRYLKGMEDAAKRGGARPPPQPRRDTSSWSGYEPSGGSGDF